MLVVSGVRVTSSLIVSLTWISIRHRLLVVVVVVFFFCIFGFVLFFFYAVFCLYFILRYQNRDYVRRHKSVSSPTQSFRPACWALVKMSSEKGLKLFHSKENKLFSLLQLLWTTLRK